MKPYIVNILCAIAFGVLTVIPAAADDYNYKDEQGYKDYLALPDSYKSPAIEEMYKFEYEAQHKVKILPCVKGGTIGQYLDKKASVSAIDDLGWSSSQHSGGIEVERRMLLGTMKLIYLWNIDLNGRVTAINGKAIGITR